MTESTLAPSTNSAVATGRVPYQAPLLREHGAMIDVTQAGLGAGSDGTPPYFGSGYSGSFS